MSFGFAVAEMVRSIKQNNSYLRGHKTFEKLRDREIYDLENRLKTHDKKVSPEELARIKKSIQENILKERKRNNFILIGSLILTISVLYMSYSFINRALTPAPYSPEAIDIVKKKNKQHEQFMFYINDGNKRLANNEFHNYGWIRETPCPF